MHDVSEAAISWLSYCHEQFRRLASSVVCSGFYILPLECRLNLDDYQSYRCIPQDVDGVKKSLHITRPVLPRRGLDWGDKINNPFGSERHLHLPPAQFQTLDAMSEEERTSTRSMRLIRLLGGHYVEQEKVIDFLPFDHPGRPNRVRNNTEEGAEVENNNTEDGIPDESNEAEGTEGASVESEPEPALVTPSRSGGGIRRRRNIRDISGGTVVFDPRRNRPHRRRMVFDRENDFGECAAMKNWNDSSHSQNIPQFNCRPVLMRNGIVVSDGSFEEFIQVRHCSCPN